MSEMSGTADILCKFYDFDKIILVISTVTDWVIANLPYCKFG